MSRKIRFKRILLKLSGETLSGGGFGLDIKAADYIAGEVKSAHNLGIQVAVVIGGGNFIRGEKIAPLGLERATADYMGMLRCRPQDKQKRKVLKCNFSTGYGQARPKSNGFNSCNSGHGE